MTTARDYSELGRDWVAVSAERDRFRELAATGAAHIDGLLQALPWLSDKAPELAVHADRVRAAYAESTAHLREVGEC